MVGETLAWWAALGGRTDRRRLVHINHRASGQSRTLGRSTACPNPCYSPIDMALLFIDHTNDHEALKGGYTIY
jgi:hypothetical protein